MYNHYRPNRNFNRRPQKNGHVNAQIVQAIRISQLGTLKNSIPEEYVTQHEFKDFEIIDQLKENILSKNYQSPTPIQDQTIPLILEGKDVIGIANTGTGKTAAFLIPLINKVYNDRTQKVLIITPTRELALQIREELREFSLGLGISITLCIGGTNMRRQIDNLRVGSNFVIGTPGRIKDLVNQRVLRLSLFNNVVLDETDRMVDIGFIDDIKFFISQLSPNRQSLFFSATVDEKVKGIIGLFVQNPVTVSVKENDMIENINQEIINIVNGKNKVDELHDLLIKEGFSKVLIFGRTKWGIQKLSDELVKRGFKAGAIHGNKRQSQRQKVLEQFKKSEINILLATDVASRGLDIEDVSHVINYDMPETFDDYIHRIGRTGRANKRGTAITFV